MPDNVFEEVENKETSESTKDESNQTVLDHKIEELKTKPVEELAKGKAHADQFIEFLKEQNAQLKEELDKAVPAEKVLEEIKTKQSEVSEENTNSGLNPEDIDSLLEQKLEHREAQKSAEANILAVDAKVREVYGDKAQDFIDAKARELGFSKEDLGAMAAKSPQAFFNLVGMNAQSKGTASVVESTVNTETMSQTTGVREGTKAWYDQIRKQDKKKFYSPEVQQKLFRDRERLGDAFYN